MILAMKLLMAVREQTLVDANSWHVYCNRSLKNAPAIKTSACTCDHRRVDTESLLTNDMKLRYVHKILFLDLLFTQYFAFKYKKVTWMTKQEIKKYI